ncbi:MAG: hypothetical protein J1F69_00570 [Clostridiales bacterium]|nr:hypothetical protein [Clostridiales bacterium]
MTQTLSAKARICSILTAIVMLLSALLISARPATALAENWTNKEYDIDPYHVCDNSCYKNIYYLTDNPYAEFYVNYFLRGMVNAYARQHSAFNEFKYYDLLAFGADWRASSLDSERFGDPKSELVLNPIKDALVILELNERLPMQFSDDELYFPTYELYFTLKKMKEKNCKIMFICNTDELFFNDCDENNRFLDLVDVHINTDIYSYFAETFCSVFTEGPVSNTTIILDKSMSQFVLSSDYIYTERGYRDIYGGGSIYGSRYGFVDGFLFPYIRKTFGFTRTTALYNDNKKLLETLQMNVLCYIDDNMFYDIAKESMYYWSPQSYPSFIEQYESKAFYFVGSTRYGDDLYELRELLIDIEETVGISLFDKYMFIEYGSFNYMENETNIHVAGLDNLGMANFIAPIVQYFLFDDINPVDWDLIDNWDGRCKVTVKPTGDDSWLRTFDDPDDTINKDDEEQYYNN